MYDDIINLPHHKSARRKSMPISDRAAQFAPFSALTGYDDAVRETARITENKVELDEYEKEKINNTILEVCNRINEKPLVQITYFIPDEKKSGGRYVTKEGRIIKVLDYENIIVFSDQTQVPVGYLNSMVLCDK